MIRLSQALSESCIETYMLIFTIIIFTCLFPALTEESCGSCVFWVFPYASVRKKKNFPSHKKDKSVLRTAQKRWIQHISLSLPLLLVSNHLLHEADMGLICSLTMVNGVWCFVNHFDTQLPTDCYCKHTFLQTNGAFYRNPMLHQLSIL